MIRHEPRQGGVLGRFRRSQDMTAQEELRALAQGLLFWIVGGSITGTGLVSLAIFLARQRLHPEQASHSWLAELSTLWAVPLAFGVVVLIHASDVWGNRRTILRILSKLQAEGENAAPPDRVDGNPKP